MKLLHFGINSASARHTIGRRTLICGIALLVMVAFSADVHAISPSANSPAALGEHPRLFFSADDLTSGRNLLGRVQSGGTHRAEFNWIKAWCDQHINDSLSISENAMLRNALLHRLIPGDTKYGDRAAALLKYTASNPSGYYRNDNGSGVDKGNYATIAVALTYDWAYDRLGSGRSTIESYLRERLKYGYDNHRSGAPSYKSEERWYAMSFIALALYGEGVDDSLCAQSLSAFVTWLEKYTGYLVATGWQGSVSYGGSYRLQNQKHITLFYEALETAADIDFYKKHESTFNFPSGHDLNPNGSTPKGLPGSEWTRYHPQALIGESRPNLMLNKFGDEGMNDSYYGYSGPFFAEYIWVMAWRYQDRLAQYWWDLVSERNPGYNTTGYYESKTKHRMYKILWHDASLKSQTPSQAGLDKKQWWKDLNRVIFRSGWDLSGSSDDIGLNHYCIYFNSYNHWHQAQNHMTLWRGTDSLLIDSGWYYYGSDQDKKYFEKTVAHNTLVVNRKNQVISHSKTKSIYDDANDNGRIVRFDATSEYGYSMGDATKAYDGADVSNATRSILYLSDKYIAVFDRVTTSTASKHKTLLWHTASEPDGNGSGWSGSGVDDSTNTTMFSFTNGDSKAYIRTLYPTKVHQTRVGGSGYEWRDLNHSSNHTAPGFKSYEAGEWRVEVRPVENNTSESFLTVIQPTGRSDSEVQSKRLASLSSNIRGASIDDPNQEKVVIFAHNETKNQDYLQAFSYSFDAGSTSRHYVADVQPNGIYTVRLSSGSSDKTLDVQASTGGVLAFTDDYSGNHSIEVSLSGSGTIPPPTGGGEPTVPGTPPGVHVQN